MLHDECDGHSQPRCSVIQFYNIETRFIFLNNRNHCRRAVCDLRRLLTTCFRWVTWNEFVRYLFHAISEFNRSNRLYTRGRLTSELAVRHIILHWFVFRFRFRFVVAVIQLIVVLHIRPLWRQAPSNVHALLLRSKKKYLSLFQCSFSRFSTNST